MKKSIFGLLLCVCAYGLAAQEIEIKGVTLGMSKTDYWTLFPGGAPTDEFSIAGIKSKYHTHLRVTFENDRLVELFFFYEPKYFEQMREALQSKYPKLACSNSTVTNRMGASFTQTDCRYKELSVSRYVSLDTASLTLIDRDYQERLRKQKADKSRSDL